MDFVKKVGQFGLEREMNRRFTQIYADNSSGG
jgi:hypothetical protein